MFVRGYVNAFNIAQLLPVLVLICPALHRQLVSSCFYFYFRPHKDQHATVENKMRLAYQLIGFHVSCGLALSPLQYFSFTNNGDRVDVPGNVNKECDGVSTFVPEAPGIALALDRYNGETCWTDGRYNHMGWSIQPGLVTSFRAYQISGPNTEAINFEASKNTIWLSFDAAGLYTVYLLTSEGDIQKVENITSPASGTFVKTTLLAKNKPTLFVVPAATRVSQWELLAPGAEGAIVFEDLNFKMTTRRWDVSAGQPYDPSVSFQRGPDYWSYRYGTRKYFFPVSNNGREGVVWQDQTTLKIFLTWLSTDLLSVSTIELPANGIASPLLEGAAGNDKGEVILCARNMYSCFDHFLLRCDR